MSVLERDEHDDYKFLRIVDAMTAINQKVNLIGVVTETGIPKQSKGTDCVCTLKIVDESRPSCGITVNVFDEHFGKLPHVESSGDIIQLSHVVVCYLNLAEYSSLLNMPVDTSHIKLYLCLSTCHVCEDNEIDRKTGVLKLATSKPICECSRISRVFYVTSCQMKTHGSEVNAVFNKKFSSFALYEGGYSSKFAPYQVSSKFCAREQDKKFIESLRKWTISHQPETASSCSLSLKEIKEGDQFNLNCKVLHICEVKDGEWMLFVWDGTDAPPVKILTKLEEEHENPLPLQLEAYPMSRDVLCKFPAVGTVLRISAGRRNEKLGIHLLKTGRWVQFRDIKFEVRSGLWCGLLLPSFKFSYLPNDDNLVLQCQRTYDVRVKGKWSRMPSSCFPGPSHITDTDYQDVPYVTLMDILSYPEVTAKFSCVVRVLATFPSHPSNFRAPCGTYRLRLTLEDPTARLHAFLYAEDAVKFFGGYPSIDTMTKMQNVLVGVEETDAISNEKPRNPPWVQCCIKSYYIDKSDIWGSRRYRIFGTKLVVD